MVQLGGESDSARLNWSDRPLQWTPTGYENPRPANDEPRVTVLTSAYTVKVLAAGQVPEVHPAAG